MVVCFLSESEMGIGMSALGVEAQLAQVEPESVLEIAGLLEPLFQEGCDVVLRGGSLDGGHAGVPAGSDFDVGRQAGGVDQALGVGDRPLVKRGDPGGERVDEIVELGVGERTVDVAEALGIGGVGCRLRSGALRGRVLVP